MISGITRYTLGAKDTAAINDVYNKAKEIYVNPDTPPSSGVIVNTVDEIWADMHDAPTGYPVASNFSYEQVRGPIFYAALPTYQDRWERANCWFEIEPAACGECADWTPDNTWACSETCSCALEMSQSSNTAVEMTPMYQAIRNGDVWTVTQNGTSTLGGNTHPTEYQLFTGNRGCDIAEVEAIREDNIDYDVHIGSSGLNELYEPKYYYRYHGWGDASFIDKTTITAIYVGQYARLILKDPNGVDDRHLAKFVMHAAADLKAADGTSCMSQDENGDWTEDCGWGIGGISRFKMLPTNGDWIPMNYLVGWITKADLEANPPPFPKSPAPI